MKKSAIFTIFIFSILFSQSNNTHIWSGISVSTSDNLDALNLNPAGLGVNRGNQYAIVLKQLPEFEDDYYFGFTNRSASGFSTEIYHDEESLKYSFGYGSSIHTNLYAGFRYSKEKDYSLGLLYRPLNALSLGTTLFSNANNSDYDNLRYGFAVRPFALKRFNSTKNSFLNYSNLTIGYDKSLSGTDSSFHEQYFTSLTLTPGIDLSLYTFKNDNGYTYGMNVGFNLGKSGVQVNSYPSNQYFNSNTASNAIAFYDYSQTIESNINFSKKNKVNYVTMDLDGYFIEEEPTISPFNFNIDFNIPFLDFQNTIGIQLRKWIDDVDKITNNDAIDGLVINLGRVKAGLAKRKEMFNALLRLKESGKNIIVYTQNDISGADYHLISMANEIYTHNMGSIDLKGFNLEVTYLKQLLDTLSIVPEVVRISPYKTGPETLIRESMSDEFKENYGKLFDDLYDIYTDDISKARKWSKERTLMTIDLGPYFSSKNAIDKELITGTMYPDEFDKYIDNLNNKDISLISLEKFSSYEKYSQQWTKDKKSKIAIIYAVGGIISGDSNPSASGSTMMGDKTIKKAIKIAREDKEIDAIILRIDSGGGSGLASDMIWREIYKTTTEDKENIKPFIASMSDAAASGGYYIACEADKIIANETSITGSIGVYWLRINFSELLKRIGIYTENITKGENADFGSGSHLLTEQEREKASNSILDMYNTFKQKVVDGRESLNDIDELDAIALGRVWSGKEAKNIGLVDEVGGLHDAINLAKESIGISKDSEVEIIELPKVRRFSFADFFTNETDSKLSTVNLDIFFSEEMSDKLKALDIVPIIMDNEIQLLVPYTININ